MIAGLIFISLFIILIGLILSIYYRTNKEFKRQRDEMQELLNVFDKNIIMSETDVHGRIIYVSEAFINISGYSKEELIGKPHRIVRHESMLKDTFQDLWKTIQSGKTWMGDITFIGLKF